MFRGLALTSFCLLLAACASDAGKTDISGIWINQSAIDKSAKGGSLREALTSYGSNFEWQINSRTGQAIYTNGFENVEGKLQQATSGKWQASFPGELVLELRTSGKRLIQADKQTENRSRTEQIFERPQTPLPGTVLLGANFERALYAAYMGGDWKIIDGPGTGNSVQFQADGIVQGLPGTRRYALCLAGDCAAMSGSDDSIWLQGVDKGNTWLFSRKGKRLEIFQAINMSLPDEVPSYRPGPRQWLLLKQ